MLFGIKTLLTEWQVGDGREQRVCEKVLNSARRGDPDHVIRTIDDFCYQDSLLINVGYRKGAILDAALERGQPQTILELGCYVGYSAIRMARKLPEGGRLYSIEFNDANAEIARKVIEHAGLSDRIHVIVGTLGDGGETLSRLESEHGLSVGSLDFVFIDHAKDAYLSDLRLILERGWLHPGSIVVADNIKVPGAPDYHAYMKEQEGKLWRSREHKSFAEYQSVIPDLVLESDYVGA
ncbi:MAG: O-methyltransferase [Alphaproteobacteria bacterium]|nr:O-methyltransferase [Alphaproteobacteria bacterium]